MAKLRACPLFWLSLPLSLFAVAIAFCCWAELAGIDGGGGGGHWERTYHCGRPYGLGVIGHCVREREREREREEALRGAEDGWLPRFSRTLQILTAQTTCTGGRMDSTAGNNYDTGSPSFCSPKSANSPRISGHQYRPFYKSYVPKTKSYIQPRPRPVVHSPIHDTPPPPHTLVGLVSTFFPFPSGTPIIPYRQ